MIAIEKRVRRASYSGLQTCGSPWTCPLCGPKIAAERAADIAIALTTHYANGGRVALVTLTLQHSIGQRLGQLLAALTGAWSAIRQNKTPRRLLNECACGWIKRLEVTVGDNGWHPHLHVLVFLRPATSDGAAGELANAMFSAWAGRLVRAGLGRPSDEHGIDCRILDLTTAHEKVAEYVAKAAALELASAGTKRGRRANNRTPMQLLHDVVTNGEAADLGKWREYEQATAGKRSLQWSAGLRDRLVGVPELTDEEAAESNDGAGRLLGVLDPGTWRRICAWKHGPAVVLNWAEVYDDDDQARDLIDRKLREHQLGGLRRPHEGPGPRASAMPRRSPASAAAAGPPR